MSRLRQFPSDLDASTQLGQRAMLDSIGGQFVERHRERHHEISPQLHRRSRNEEPRLTGTPS